MAPMSMVQEVGEFERKGLKVIKSCVPGRGQFLLTCSDTFAIGCIVYPQCTLWQTDGQTVRQMLTVA